MEKLIKIRNDLEKTISTVINTSSYQQVLIQADVGIGKTHCIQHIDKLTNEYPLLCFPTHSLKDEFAESVSFDHIKTPRPPKGFTELHLQLLEKELNYEETHKKLKQKFSSYYDEFYSTIQFPGVVLTTHDAFLISPQKFNQQLVVFDEVPNYLFGKIETTSLLGIYEGDYLIDTYNLHNGNHKDLINLKIELNQLKQLCENNKPKIETDTVLLHVVNPLSYNSRLLLIKLFNNDRYNRQFPKIVKILQHDTVIINYNTLKISSYKKTIHNINKKIMCLSATPDKDVFSSYGFDVIKMETPQIKANVVHVDINTSKLALQNSTTCQKINKTIIDKQIEQVITFKDFNNVKRKNQTVYFGNTEGTNDLINVNTLGIVGTPMNNVQYFYDMALICNKPITVNDLIMEKKKLIFPQKSIIIQTFKNSWLTEKHIEQISIEYQQAIGRVRPYNRPSTIYLFSKLPLFSNETLNI